MDDSETSQLSALRENINRKGTNSYYYGHATQRNGPQWDGKEEPRLLGLDETPSAPVLFAHAFASYSYGDEKKSVKLYIDFELATSVADEQISLTSTSDSLTFHLSNVNGKDYKLVLSPLYNEIVSATYKKKDDMFVLTVKKAEETSWSSLLKK